MATIGVASTALHFLATIGPDDQVWDDGVIEAFVEQVHALATQKRLARQQSGFQRAIAALRAEVDSLPGGDVEIDLAPLETADLARLDPTMVLSRIEALTAAIAVYRQTATTLADANPRTIAERAAMYQAMGASLSRIMEQYDCLLELASRLFVSPISTEDQSLKKHIQSIASKQISEAEISNFKSNQHEIHGTLSLIKLLGSTATKKIFKTRFIYISENADYIHTSDTFTTWYDSRKNNPKRTEYRLYYKDATILHMATAGDLLVIAILHNNNLIAVISKQNSLSFKKILWLAGLVTPIGMRRADQFQEPPFDSSAKLVVKALSTAIESSVTGHLEVV